MIYKQPSVSAIIRLCDLPGTSASHLNDALFGLAPIRCCRPFHSLACHYLIVACPCVRGIRTVHRNQRFVTVAATGALRRADFPQTPSFEQTPAIARSCVVEILRIELRLSGCKPAVQPTITTPPR